MSATTDSVRTTDSLATNAADPGEAGAFLFQLYGWLVGAAAVSLVDVGHRTGALDALAAAPATAAELAERSGLSERHVREWLAGLATAGIAELDPPTGRYSLPVARAAALVGAGPTNVAPLAQAMMFLTGFAPSVARTMREGGGIPYSEYQPEFSALQDGINRRLYDAALVDGYIGRVDGLTQRLRDGIAVLDVGCGSGHVVNLLARAFPASSFVGYDLAEEGLQLGRDEAASWSLTNASFERRDVVDLPAGSRFDLVTAFDAIHDQVQPRAVLRGINEALADGGTFLMIDMNASSAVADNIGNPIATYFYWVSLFHCMQVSLAEGGEGLGTAWGVQLARQLLADAGFGHVDVLDAPNGDPVNAIFVCRR
jgi:SAM-dependent methyltransferase